MPRRKSAGGTVWIAALSATTAVSACLEKSALDPALWEHLDLQEDSVVLSARVTYIADLPLAVSLDGFGLGGGAAKDFELLHQAQVAPPSVSGVSLQASHVTRRGNRAYVAYNVRGATFRGGVDVFDKLDGSKPVLTSQALFYDTEVSAVDLSGSALYMATATADESFSAPAVLEVMALSNGGKGLAGSISRTAVSSFAATGVRAFGGEIYVTSGSGGGLTVFDGNMNVVFTESIGDARAVDVTNDLIVVMRGTPGTLRVYDRASRRHLRDIALAGANVANSKSSLFLVDDLAFAAAGDGGLVVANVRTGQVVERLPVPSVSGVSAANSVLNGVAYNKDLVFMAFGEAGLWVAEADKALTGLKGAAPGLEMVGRIQLPGSANFVAAKGDRLWVATGAGGLNIIKVND